MKANKNLIAGKGSTSGCRTCSHNCNWAFGMTVHTTSTSRALRIVSALQKNIVCNIAAEKAKGTIKKLSSRNEIIQSRAALNYRYTIVAF